MRIHLFRNRLGFRARCLTVLMLCLALLAAIREAYAQEEYLKPGDNLVTVGIPKIPKSLLMQLRKYHAPFGSRFVAWHPEKREMWLNSGASPTLLSRVEAPGERPRIWMSINDEEIYDLYFQPQAKYLIYNREKDGDENYQMYLYDLATRKKTLLSAEKTRNTEFVWSHSGDKVIYCYVPPNGEGVSLYTINPFDPSSNRLLVQSKGPYLKAYDWSPDDKKAAFLEYTSNFSSKLYIVDVDTGKTELISPKNDNQFYFDLPAFSKDGKGLYVLTDYKSEFKRLTYVDLKTKKLEFLTGHIKWDVEDYAISPDGKYIIADINEEGYSRLYSIDTTTKKITRHTSVPEGIISGLKWHNNSTDVGFNFVSRRAPIDAYSLNVKTGKLERWAESYSGQIDMNRFSLPELIHWNSFDGRRISGFIYRPTNSFSGKRPVIIDIHGGPEAQYRPSYSVDDNFYINELGIVKIYPNLRGSTGYGRTFHLLDNGTKRGNVVKDIGALLDWIKVQPDLDVDRIIVQGGSYGGYLALSAAAAYSDRLKGAVSKFGISNILSAINGTNDWRNHIHRVEFGDEKDPRVKTYLTKIAPLTNVNSIKTTLFIVHGKNDPRVPYQESESVVKAAQRSGNDVWYLLAKDEGHGFTKQPNAEFLLCSLVVFAKGQLLK